MPILGLDHVQIAIPVGGEEKARAFYSGILGFSEIAKPGPMAARNSLWFAAGPVNLHLGIASDFHPAKRAHPALIVDDLDRIVAACGRASLTVKPDTSFNGFRRTHVFDPFGNRLELMERAAA
jgi:catechol 2,3-dioxygenase-like lactoylglutathione lyase family enzyme